MTESLNAPTELLSCAPDFIWGSWSHLKNQITLVIIADTESLPLKQWRCINNQLPDDM